LHFPNIRRINVMLTGRFVIAFRDI
jgi:hypothetical protein